MLDTRLGLRAFVSRFLKQPRTYRKTSVFKDKKNVNVAEEFIIFTLIDLSIISQIYQSVDLSHDNGNKPKCMADFN